MDLISEFPFDGVLERLDEEVRRVTEEVRKTGRKGRITLILEVKLEDYTLESPLVGIQATIKSTLPARQLPVATSYFYDGRFQRSPRSQLPLLKDIVNIERGNNG